MEKTSLTEIENEAELLMRFVATDRLPVDAGAIAKLCQLIRAARMVGYKEGLDQGRVDGYYGNLPPCPECKQAIESGYGHMDNCDYARRG